MEQQWVNEQYTNALEMLALIDYESKFTAAIRDTLPGVIEEREDFAFRNKNEFDVTQNRFVRLYIKKDCDQYTESLNKQKDDFTRRSSEYKNLNATTDFDKGIYLGKHLSSMKSYLWAVDTKIQSISDQLPYLPERTVVKGNVTDTFRKRHETEFNIKLSNTPKIVDKRDAKEYLESLKIQKNEFEIRISTLTGMGANADYLGNTTQPALKVDFDAHVSSTTLAHGGITPSTHVGSGGTQHALANESTGAAGFISGTDLSHIKNKLDELDEDKVGMVVMFAGTTPPDKWVICDGQALIRDDYSALFSIIGITYGEGNGTTTFNVPNLTTTLPSIIRVLP